MSEPSSPEAAADDLDAVPAPQTGCPLCGHFWDCEHRGSPRQECEAIWPLNRPAGRRPIAASDLEVDMLLRARKKGWLSEILEVWEAGGQVRDEQYVKLRDKVLNASRVWLPVYSYVLTNLLSPRSLVYQEHARIYYGFSGVRDIEWEKTATSVTWPAVLLTTRELVEADAEAPVPSHFERVFFEIFKFLLYGIARVTPVQMPEEDDAFCEAVDREWRKVLRYGNGHFGLTVIPRITPLDMVRYQRLGGLDPLVSWSIANYIIWTMDVFPVPVQYLRPEFRELGFMNRLMDMFEPLVHAHAEHALRRQWHEAPADRGRHDRVADELRVVLRRAIEEYDFMHGKSGNVADGAGLLGLESSPAARREVDRRLQELGLPVTSGDLAHVGVARYAKTRLEAYLREHYRPRPRDWAGTSSIDDPLNNDADETLADALYDPNDMLPGDGDHHGMHAADGAPRDPVKGSVVIDGQEYLFVDEAALWCGVTAKQLRYWDETGELPVERLGQLSPAHRRGKSSDWRVYAKTPQLRMRVIELAEERKQGPDSLREGEFRRSTAANVLGKSTRTLRRWEQSGKARPERRAGMVVYTAAEVERLAQKEGIKIRPPSSE